MKDWGEYDTITNVNLGGNMLELRNLTYEVESRKNGKVEKKKIIDNLSIVFDENKTYAITGPNGSGKSTLAKLIMGMAKPTSGKIIFNGKDITKASITERAKMGICFAFQQPVRFKGLLVRDLISLAVGREVEVGEACGFLSDVGLCARDYINREVDESLSGGELKRIEIAQMVARKGKVVIFDEPEAGIDLWSFNNLIEVFKKMKEKSGGLKIIISHQERLINYADQVVLIESGKITDVGAPQEVIEKTHAKRMCKVMEGNKI